MTTFRVTAPWIVIHPPVEDYRGETSRLRESLLEHGGKGTIGMAIEGVQHAAVHVTVEAEDDRTAGDLGLNIIDEVFDDMGLAHVWRDGIVTEERRG
jgi:hypothetical protein